jgi:hypothetical protein
MKRVVGNLAVTLILLAAMNFPTPICSTDANGSVTSNLSPFMDAENHDFRLRPNSCAVDRGMTIPSVRVDIRGVTRPQGPEYDIGAFEHEKLSAPKGLKIK